MTRKRTLVVATAISAVLLGVSAAFALSSGLFGARRAEQVGTFQAIEQRLSPVPAISTTTTSATTTGVTSDVPEPRSATSPTTDAPRVVEPAPGSTPETSAPRAVTATTTVERSHEPEDATTTTPSVPTHHDPTDDGSRSDD
jgi:hypothetical protein